MSTLSEMLYQARREAGYSLKDISNGTHIRMTYLEALENGSYDSLPVKGYVRLFINSYANFCNKDPRPFLIQYEHEIGIPADEITVDRSIGASEVVPPSSQQHTINWRVALIISGAIVVVALSIWLAFSLSHQKKEVTPAPITPASLETSATDSISQSATKPFKLDITVDEGSATQVKLYVDGAQAYDGVLTSANRLTYDVLDSAKITIANPNVVTVTQDGKSFILPDGNNVTVTLKAQQ